MTTTEIDWEKFEEQYKPIQNTISNREEVNGWQFETYGKDVEHIKKFNEEHPNNVWTILDCGGYAVISSGWHYVNREGYIITEVPFKEGEDITVVDDDERQTAEFRDEAFSYLEDTYGLEPEDTDLDDYEKIGQALTAKQTPEEYVDEYAEKHDLTKINE